MPGKEAEKQAPIRSPGRTPASCRYRTVRAAIDERLNYFRVNEGRMRYGEFRRRGYVIGSGAVEGACRSVINQRADLSGQRWHPDGALNVLRIRGMVMDGIHEDYWKRRGTVRRLEVA